MKKASKIHFREEFPLSSSLNMVVYWTDMGGDKVLTVLYAGGGLYDYYDVPASVADHLRNNVADHLRNKTPDFSPGKFVSANVKGMYRYAAVTALPELASEEEMAMARSQMTVEGGALGVKDLLESAVEALASDYVPGRETALVKTKIEEALLWLTKAEVKP